MGRKSFTTIFSAQLCLLEAKIWGLPTQLYDTRPPKVCKLCTKEILNLKLLQFNE